MTYIKNTPADTHLADDINDIEESLYELHLRMRDMIQRHLWNGETNGQRMAGLLIESLDGDLIALYQRGAQIRHHLR
ncbi:hypothetical protein BL250_00655 [Erwinia sp. OLTSP20]|uniref:hypothetical protein n=1 Tax=unclassified Erwinia TaxID=2622719 RepID=UPI000C17730C|nr:MULTISPECIES: hypothetical protein [unclassified Erwinia]PIJ52136.1 hypothetical protein BV501_00815 [Erwinia sp. OAMSP11]PIJ73155.1 hypothetical protein BK416_07835 [Erwinia sp. OLSSP12]PIJ84664.1 hypothetical protein BLD47_01635 [Erwinia sp. OLCASP19]PIJ87311.1 hypothetical protein BLD46_00780 [Erwinia sp. OLMTSP26]PIJ87534.1 hypothetical protein BLD49_05895 [Erwinia sp. OLMDSP33]